MGQAARRPEHSGRELRRPPQNGRAERLREPLQPLLEELPHDPVGVGLFELVAPRAEPLDAGGSGHAFGGEQHAGLPDAGRAEQRQRAALTARAARMCVQQVELVGALVQARFELGRVVAGHRGIPSP